MKYLVFSDIHGNLPALEAVVNFEKDVEGYINLGDVVNYGPWSNECVQLLAGLANVFNIKGNHESYFISGKCNVKNDLVQKFFEITYENFTEVNTINKYQEVIHFNNFSLIHTIGEKDYIFKDTNLELDNNYFLGHSHQQFLRFLNNKMLVNPGSVGQNRKRINVSEYVVWDIYTGEIALKSLKFDINSLLSKMKSEKYPQVCIDYYTSKTIIL